MSDLFDLTGQRALITGAQGGIGQSIARHFGSAGATLVLSHREEVAGMIAADLSRLEDVTSLVRQAGDIDVLVCNAGIEGPVGPLANATTSDLACVMQVNLFTTASLCHALIPGMAAGGVGWFSWLRSRCCAAMARLALMRCSRRRCASWHATLPWNGGLRLSQ